MKLSQAKIAYILKVMTKHERLLTNRGRAPLAEDVRITREIIKDFQEIRR